MFCVWNNLTPVRFYASLQKSNSYIAPVRNDEYDIESVIFLRCTLKSNKGMSDAYRILHSCFPNPTVLLIESELSNGIEVSVAIRRKSQAEKGAFVTEAIYTSGLFHRGVYKDDESSKGYEQFLADIALSRLPQNDLLAYVRGLGNACRLAGSVRLLGYYPQCEPARVEELMLHVAKLESLERKLNEIDRLRKDKDISLNDSAKLRVQSMDVKREIEAVRGQVQEVCVRE